MSFNPVTAVIDLATTPATVTGFGTLLFVSAHKFFKERVQVFNAESDAAALPSNSDEAKAVQMYFKQNPTRPILLGRREIPQVSLTPSGLIASGASYSITVSVNDGDSITATYVAGAGDTAAIISTSLQDQINGDLDVSAHVTATVSGDVLTISEDTTADVFSIDTASGNFTYTQVVSETPTDSLDEIDLENSNYYGVTSNEQNSALVTEFSSAVASRSKLFLHCSDDLNCITAWNGTDAGVDILADLLLASNGQTVPIYHNQAREIFPQVGVFARFAGKGIQPGKIAWNWKSVNGVPPSRDGNGKVLSPTHIANLLKRNANTFERGSTGTIFGPGLVSSGSGDRSGEWIEHITAKDFITARAVEAFKTKFTITNKMSFSRIGVTAARSTLASVFERYVETETVPNILTIDQPYIIEKIDVSKLSFSQIASQVIPLRFTLFLSGTITGADLVGQLTYSAQV